MNKPIIFIENIVADIAKGYADAFQRNIYEDDSFVIQQFTSQIPNFFRLLPVNEKGMKLFNLLRNDYNIIFLVKPWHRRDQIEWIKKYVGEYTVLFSDNKAEFVINKKNVLIDSNELISKSWVDAGGIGISFSQRLDKIVCVIEKVFNPKKQVKKKSVLNKIKSPAMLRFFARRARHVIDKIRQ